MPAATAVEVETPGGLAGVHLHAVDRPRAALLLGHGAGGGVEAPDLVTARDVALDEQVAVALVEQPYRVAGRRSPPPVARLDADWSAVVERLREDELSGLPLVVGGRSLGARVACRTSEELRAVAVLCLAFPLRPPQRRSGKPSPSRLGELDAVKVPTLVVQGASDPFGIPPPGPMRTVIEVPGTHSLRTEVAPISDAVRTWLSDVIATGG
jgi:uncharacterized protein